MTNNNVCSRCTPPVVLNSGNAQTVLAHIGAHILHDKSLNRNDELCGLYLQPSLICKYFVLPPHGTKGSHRIDQQRSEGCTRMLKFSHGKAEVSSDSAPCSNVPIHCPICGKSKPAMWRYNLEGHLKTKHSDKAANQHSSLWAISQGERVAMNHVWVNRQPETTKRNRKSNAPALVVSDVHTSVVKPAR